MLGRKLFAEEIWGAGDGCGVHHFGEAWWQCQPRLPQGPVWWLGVRNEGAGKGTQFGSGPGHCQGGWKQGPCEQSELRAGSREVRGAEMRSEAKY